MVPVGMYTETLARLYMRQGHVDKALRIYRYLAAQQPSDTDLQDQIHTLEHQLTLRRRPMRMCHYQPHNRLERSSKPGT